MFRVLPSSSRSVEPGKRSRRSRSKSIENAVQLPKATHTGDPHGTGTGTSTSTSTLPPIRDRHRGSAQALKPEVTLPKAAAEMGASTKGANPGQCTTTV